MMKKAKRCYLSTEIIRTLSSKELTSVEGGGSVLCAQTGTYSAQCVSVTCTDDCHPVPTAGCETHN